MNTLTTVGILIHSSSGGLFSNGMLQNGYFLYKCLQNAGFVPIFLCKDTPVPFAHKSISLQQFSTDPSIYNVTSCGLIITLTKIFNEDESAYLKKNHVTVVSYTCGNQIVSHHEEFLFDLGLPTSAFTSRFMPIDEVWLIPSYAHAKHYIEVVRDRPVFLVPHLWSSSILLDEAKSKFHKTVTDLTYNPLKHASKKIDVVIVEPNIQTFKSAWIPLVACEKLMKDVPDLIDNIYVFNFPKHKRAHDIVSHMKIQSKIKKFARMHIAEIMAFFNSKDTMPIFVSYQYLNGLNYLYYELLAFGYPLVHNSTDMGACGYHYPDTDVAKCAEAIQRAHKNYAYDILEQKKHTNVLLQSVNPDHSEVVNTIKTMVLGAHQKYSH